MFQAILQGASRFQQVSHYVLCKGRILLQDLLERVPQSSHVENDGNRDPGSCNDGCATTNVWIRFDDVANVFLTRQNDRPRNNYRYWDF